MPDTAKILVVDDEEVIRDLLREVLGDEGYDVATAPGGPQALDLLEQDRDFVLLFTDLMMPDMHGLELIRRARALRPAIIPIVMTAFATLDTARAAVREGAYEYVLKPFSLTEVKLAVANALDRYRLTNENARLLELTELFNISERIAAIHEERQLLDFVLNAALDRVRASRGSIMVFTDDRRALEIRASIGIAEDFLSRPVELRGTIAGLVATSAKPMLVTDADTDPEVAGISRRLDHRSFVSVPLEHRPEPRRHDGSQSAHAGEVIAVLNVSHKLDGRPFSESDLKILRIVANHAAAAIRNVRLIRDIERSHLATVESMALLLEARDRYTQHHSRNVRDMCVAMARRLGLPASEVDALRVGAAFHDIGKVGVPDHVLNKPDRLDDAEWAIMRQHPVTGYDVLAPIHFLGDLPLQIVRGHHERIDGSGYPDGKQGDEVTTPMRIIAVADSYDAMAGDRAYRPALPTEVIVQELRRGVQRNALDARVVGVFLDMLGSGEIARILQTH